MNIYFSGIGGVGIGPLAEIAHDAGYVVYGSDAQESLTTQELSRRGLTVSFDQSGTYLEQTHHEHPLDWYIYTAALPDDHPELVKARQLGIKTKKRDGFIELLIREKNLKLIAVAGTHGKTTTTGMLVWTLQKLGIPASYSVGTTLTWGPSGKFDPSSSYFVYECDEFDRNFLKFSPALSLVTSIEYDHPDTYQSPDEYRVAFRQFLDQSSQAIIWSEDAQFIDYHAASAWILQEDEVLKCSLAGAHNRRNATLVAKAIEFLGLGDPQQTIAALEEFPGTNRRFEKLADNLYSDYGHTPTEIAATLQLARELSDAVMLVYQPHQNIRQHEIRDQYTDAVFRNAEIVYWLPTYLSREDPTLAVLSPLDLTSRLSPRPTMSQLDDELWQQITAARRAGKLVLCMGAGTIDSWMRQKITS